MFFYPDDDQNPKDDPVSPGDDDQPEEAVEDATGLGKEDDYLDDGIEESDEVE